MSNEPQQYIRPAPRKVTGQRLPAPVDADGALAWDEPAQPRGPGRNVVGAAAPQLAPPATLTEARDRFINRYLFLLIGALLGGAIKEPTSVAEWVTLATAVKRVLDTRAEVRQAVKR